MCWVRGGGGVGVLGKGEEMNDGWGGDGDLGQKARVGGEGVRSDVGGRRSWYGGGVGDGGQSAHLVAQLVDGGESHNYYWVGCRYGGIWKCTHGSTNGSGGDLRYYYSSSPYNHSTNIKHFSFIFLCTNASLFFRRPCFFLIPTLTIKNE